VVAVRPSSDVTIGGWTNESGGTTLFSSVNEASQSDANYIKSSNNPSNDTTELQLPATGVLIDGTLKIALGKGANNSVVINHRVALVQGTTEIAAWDFTDVAFGFPLQTVTLTAPEFAAITDFSDLRIRITANVPSGLAELVTLRDGTQVTDRAGNSVTLRTV
jgi:hypothetical protein